MSEFRGREFKIITAVLLLSGSFLFFGNVKNSAAALLNSYTKLYNGTLTAQEWNNLKADFVATFGGVSMIGPLAIGTTTLPGTGLLVDGPVVASNFSGGNLTGGIDAANVMGGNGSSFGSNFGGGNYSFPNNVGIGTTNPRTKLQISGDNTGVTGRGTFSLVKNEEDYGLFAGVSGTGDTWMQTRIGGSSTYYNLLLNPNGGNVGIGTTTPGTKLDVFGGAIRTNSQLISTVANGTAPLVVTSGTLVANLNVDLLDGVQGTSYFKNGDAVMNTNSFGGRPLYINSINDAMFRADSRWTVTGNYYNASGDTLVGAIPSGSLAALFDGDYESGMNIPVGQYAVVNVNFNGNYPGYPYGNFYLSHYYNNYSSTSTPATVRTYSNYVPHGVGWHTYTFSTFVDNGSSALVLKARNDVYNISQAEFKIYAPSSGLAASVTAIDWQLDRPWTNEMPFVDKYRANTLYSTLSLNNNASTKISLNPAGNSWFSNGNFGVGTSSPGAKLDILGSLRASSATVTNLASPSSSIIMADTAGNLYATSSSVATGIPGGTSGQTLRMNGAGWIANSFLYNNGAAIGIGTTAPGTGNLLNIKGVNPAGTMGYGDGARYTGQVAIESSDAYTTQKGGRIAFSGIAGAGGGAFTGVRQDSIYGTIEGYKQNNIANNAGGGLIFSTNYNPDGRMYERMRINDFGNVGIGTSSPTRLLTVSGTGANQGFQILSALGTRLNYIGGAGSSGATAEQGYFELRDNATPEVVFNTAADSYINTGGDFGFGTSTPTSNLSVKGASSAPSIVSGAQAIFDVYSGSGTDLVFTSDSNSPYPFSIQNRNAPQGGNGTYPIALNPLGGNIGIGVTNPGATLDVGGTIGSFRAKSGTLSNIGSGVIMADASGNLYSTTTAAATGIPSPAGLNGQTLRSNGTSWVANNLLYNNGTAIGIGTTTPAEALTISGGDLSLNNSIGGNQRFILNTGWNGSLNYFGIKSVLNGASTFVLTSLGNVGIGTTTPGAKLDVNGSFRLNRPLAMVDSTNTLGGNIAFVPSTLSASDNGYLNLYYPATTSVKFATNYDGNLAGAKFRDIIFGRYGGADYLTIKDGGNVGIGTTNPEAKLEVAGRLNVGDFATNGVGSLQVKGTGPDNGVTVWNEDGGVTWRMWLDGPNNIGYLTRGSVATTGLAIDASGNVGVGVTNPGTTLDVGGAIGSFRAKSGTLSNIGSGIIMADGSGNLYSTSSLAAISAGWTVNGTTVYKTDLNGNVGIGTTNPGTPLEIKSSSDNILRLRQTGGGWNYIEFYDDTIRNGYFGMQGNDFNFSPVGNTTIPSGGVAIGTTTPGTAKLAILGGSVGIGNTSPLYLLSVKGNSGQDTALHLWQNGIGAGTIGFKASDNKLYISNTLGGTGDFGAASKSITLDTSGKVGIGTTTPASLLHTWSNTGNSLIVEADADNSGEDDNASVVLRQDGNLVNGIFATMGNAGQYAGAIANAVFLEAKDNGGNSTLQFVTGGTTIGGTNGAARMTILNAGNVGVGTANPGATLDVGDTIGSFRAKSGTLSNIGAGLIMADASGNLYSTTSAAATGIPSPAGLTGQTLRSDGTNWIANNLLFNDGTNVGIGTTTPGSKLEIYQGAAGTGLRLSQATGVYGATQPFADYYYSGSQIFRFFMDNTRTLNIENVSNSGGAGMILKSTNASADISLTSGRNVIVPSGNVGIGTTNPGAKLDFGSSGANSNVLLLYSSGNFVKEGFANAGYGLKMFTASDPSAYISFGTVNSADGVTESEKMRITNAGNVGIGTTSTGATLDVSGATGSFRAKSGTLSNIGSGIIMADASGNLYSTSSLAAITAGWTVNGTTVYKTDINGNVGIGTTAPTAKLEINSNAITNQLNVYNNAGGFVGTMLHIDQITRGDTTAYNLLNIENSAGSALFIRGDRNVGIGTTSPAYKLDVNGDLRASDRIIVGDYPNSVTNSGEAWLFRAADRTAGTLTVQLGGATATNTKFEVVDRAWTKVISSISGEAPGGSLTVQPTGNVTMMGGNVGIGMTNPAQKLDVIGSIQHSGSLISSAGGFISTWMQFDGILNGNSLILGAGGLTALGSGESSNLVKANISGSQESLYLSSDGDIQFTTNLQTSWATRVDAMTILTGGNVGISTTNPGATLDVGGTIGSFRAKSGTLSNIGAGLIMADASGNLYSTSSAVATGIPSPVGISGQTLRSNGTNWVANNLLYVNGTNVGVGTTTLNSKLAIQGSGADILNLFDSAGTEKVSVLSTGNVGIGNTNPSFALDVTGAARITSQGGNILSGDYEDWVADGLTGKNISFTQVLANTFSLVADRVDDGAGTYGYITQTVNFGDTQPANKTYTFSAMVQRFTVTGANSSQIFISFLDAADTVLGTTLKSGTGGSTAWERLSATAVAPANTQKIKVGVGANYNEAVAFFGYTLNEGATGVLSPPNTDNSIAGSNNIKAFTAGVERLRIISSGNVGIGTTSPVQKLDVNGRIRFQDYFEAYYGGTTLSGRFGSSYWLTTPGGSTDSSLTSANNIYFAPGNTTTPSMVISSNGNVGINANVPGATLDVSGTIGSFRAKSGTLSNIGSGIIMADASGNLYSTSSLAALTAGWTVNGTTVYKTDINGNVGIGTTNPGAKLELSGGAALFQLTTSDYVLGSAGSRTIIGFGANTGNTYSRIQTTDVGGNSASDLILQSDSGNVGIGTTSPQAKLHIGGDGYALYGPNSTWNSTLRVGGNGNVTTDASVATTNGNLHLDAKTGSMTYINFYHGTGVNFGNGGGSSIVANINSTGGGYFLGNVAIGTTTAGHKLDITGNININGSFKQWGYNIFSTTLTGAEFNNNVYYQTLGLFTNGAERLRIDSTGNVGIGVTNPGATLDIGGAIASFRAKSATLSNIGAGLIMADASGNLYSTSSSAATGIPTPVGISGQTLRSNGTDWIANSILFNDGTNVGVGTTTAAYKLQVDGSFSATASSSSIILDANGDISIGI